MSAKPVFLTPEQWNVVASGLGELPLKFAGPVLAAIQRQLTDEPSPDETKEAPE